MQKNSNDLFKNYLISLHRCNWIWVHFNFNRFERVPFILFVPISNRTASFSALLPFCGVEHFFFWNFSGLDAFFDGIWCRRKNWMKFKPFRSKRFTSYKMCAMKLSSIHIGYLEFFRFIVKKIVHCHLNRLNRLILNDLETTIKIVER